MGSKRKKKKTKRNKVNPTRLKREIINLLNSNPSKSFTLRKIIKKLGYRDKASKEVIPSLVFELEGQNKIRKLRNNSFKSIKEARYITGIVDHVNAKYAYIISDQMEEDVWIKANNLNFAMDQDEVKIVLLGQKHGRRPEGKVVEIIRRGRSEMVGRVETLPKYAFVIPDNKKIYFDIFIPPENINKAKNNDKVIVEILEWPSHDKNPVGKITRILGQAGENEAEIHSIMAEFGLPFSFPGHVIKSADKIKGEITEKEIKKRRDFRKILTFTIDPEDAKDFDDALSFRKLKNGNYEVGIHIADVTHYVRTDTVLDDEAYKRATSVYLVDRTIPMLPEKLSNELCSLNPNEDKLTFSAVFEFDNDAHIKNKWFGKTIIHSDRRFTYEEAQERIESLEGDLAKELTILNELALKLRVERFMLGAINFETVEVKFDLDEKGKPLGVIPKIRKDAHKLIEEFMLLANKKVAEHIYKMKSGNKRKTFVYRTHDFPDQEKLHEFAVFAKRFGHDLKLNEDSISKSFNELIEAIEGKPEQNVLETLAIRTMAKAKYTTEAKGHFGLAFPHYTHFTSPIRRYPDVLVHRLLYKYLNKGDSVSKDEYEEKCEHSSEMEIRATDAERASIKYKQVEYMQNAEEKDYKGIVSGVTEWGIFVELVETKCEGMIKLSDLTDDYYEFDERNYCVIGESTKKIITLGDPLIVRVKSTDIDRRTIDLELVKAESYAE